MHDLNISFFIRSYRPNERGEVPIYCRITMRGRSCDFSIKRKVDPGKWVSRGGFVKGTSLQAKELNHHLNVVRNKFYSLHTEFINKGTPLTPVKLRDALLDNHEHQKSVAELFEEYIQQLQRRVGYDIRPGTLEKYRVTVSHFMTFIYENYNRKDVELTELTYQYIRDFSTFLKTNQEISHNTTVKLVRNLKKMIKWGVHNEWLTKNPFYGYSLTYEEIDTIYLTEDELVKLEQCEPNNQQLREVKDLFVFSCYTGIAYADLARLTSADISVDNEGHKWLVFKRRKTGTQSTVYLLPEPVNIIERYRNHPACELYSILLPVPSNKVYNHKLKELASISGINKNLTSHVARHTCATFFLNRDLPLKTVQKILGHKSIKETERYARLLNKKVKRDMKGLQENLRNIQRPGRSAN